MSQAMDRLLDIMNRLRNPVSGCPWDVKQTHQSLTPYVIEEAYEVVDAIHSNDPSSLKEELGDLLLQVVFHSQIARESKTFSFEQVVEGLCDKLVRRHPNVFADHSSVATADEQSLKWEDYKAAERAEKAAKAGQTQLASALDDVPGSFPALLKAQKLLKKAKRVGFDWPNISGPLQQLKSEVAELEESIVKDHSPAEQFLELGDVLFMGINMAIAMKMDPESALRAANEKFERRFRYLEQRAAQSGKPLETMSLADMEPWWKEAKEQDLNKTMSDESKRGIL